MRGFALLRTNAFTYDKSFVIGNLTYPLTARKRQFSAVCENKK